MPSDLKFTLSATYNDNEYALAYRITAGELRKSRREKLQKHLAMLATTVLRNLELQEGLKFKKAGGLT